MRVLAVKFDVPTTNGFRVRAFTNMILILAPFSYCGHLDVTIDHVNVISAGLV